MKIDPIFGSHVEDMRTVLKDFCKTELHDDGRIYKALVKLENELNDGMESESPNSIRAGILKYRDSYKDLIMGANKKPGRELDIGELAGSLFETLISRCLNEKCYGHEREPNGAGTFPDYKLTICGKTIWFDCKCVKIDGPSKRNKDGYKYQLKNAASNEEELCNGLKNKQKVRAALAIMPFYNYDTLEVVAVKIVPMMYMYQVCNKNTNGIWRFGIKSRGDKVVKNAKVIMYLTTFVGNENKHIMTYAEQRRRVMEAVHFHFENKQ